MGYSTLAANLLAIMVPISLKYFFLVGKLIRFSTKKIGKVNKVPITIRAN